MSGWGWRRTTLPSAAGAMATARGFLVEEMAPPPAAEILIGLRRDPVYGMTLTVGMGGIDGGASSRCGDACPSGHRG